jgi:dTDP-4-amino-4,6-dideoxygalactose transaminase
MNASPVFMDCDNYYNIDAEKTIDFIEKETTFRNGYTYNRKTGKRISAIIPVHIFGNAVDLKPLITICDDRNIKIIEDASESLGTRYLPEYLEGRHTGTIGKLGCLSFNGNKIITTGGGGMILTNNAEYAEKAVYLTTQAKDDQVRYIHNEIGYNYRLSNIQAALGVAQLEKLPEYLEIKKNNYELYRSLVKDIAGLKIAEVPVYADNNYWMYALQLEPDIYPSDIELLMAQLEEKGIQTRPVWKLNHLQKPYNKFQTYRIDKAIELHKCTLNVPCSSNLKEQQIEKVVNYLKCLKS